LVDVIKLIEGSRSTGTGARRRARLIEANTWGSTAYYPAEVLERDGARVFHKGLHIYENHRTESESYERPEGDVRNFIGVLASDAAFEVDGLYADVEFFESYVPRINEIADHIGLSVNAQGMTEAGEREGRYGPILVGLLEAGSVDIVTRAGAGGKLVSILESDTGTRAGTPIEKNKTEGKSAVADLTKEDFEAHIAALTEAISSIPASIAAAVAANAATAAVEEEVVETDIASEAVVEVEIDHAAVIDAINTNQLPAAVTKNIVEALRSGSTLEDAVAEQVSLREAFVATHEVGTVHLQESESKLSGIARSVQILG
jgi:hypothetical protein